MNLLTSVVQTKWEIRKRVAFFVLVSVELVTHSRLRFRVGIKDWVKIVKRFDVICTGLFKGLKFELLCLRFKKVCCKNPSGCVQSTKQTALHIGDIGSPWDISYDFILEFLTRIFFF